jgi:hypothetical protein
MTDELNFSVSYNTVESPPEQRTGLIAFGDCELIGIDNAMMMAINRNNGHQQIVAPQVVEGLKSCTSFYTLADHAAYLAKTRPELGGNQAVAASALGNLKDAGMLLQAKDICSRLSQAAPVQLAPTRAFLITCDRPAAVERLLESMLSDGKLSQHDGLFLVDDSKEQENRDANAEMVARFNLHSTKSMFYVGLESQQALLSGLVEKLPDHTEGIRFLMDPALWRGKKTYGRSRTLCLLLSVGYRALLMDDDILCQAIRPPVTDAGIGISSGNLRKVAFFADRGELLRSAIAEEFDPLSGHASLLGSTLGPALISLNDGPFEEEHLHGVNAGLANVLHANSPILVTQCGSWGDPGTGGAHWGLNLEEGSIRRLISAPQGVVAALENRLAWLGSSRPNLFKKSFMSQLTGLDNSRLLPPYFPAFRGEDGLFGAMTVAMHPDSVALEYPWSVPHLPLEERRMSLREPIAAPGDLLGLLSNYLTSNIDYRDATDPQHNLHLLARDALRMAARTDADLLLDFRSNLARVHATQFNSLQHQLAQAQTLPSPQWQEYLKRGVEEVKRAIGGKQSPTNITGVPQSTTEQELVSQFRGMAQGFAAGLDAWVEMRNIATALTDDLISSKKILPQ